MNMLAGVRARVLLAALVTVGAGSVLAYWSAERHEQQEAREDVMWLVRDTSLRLRTALSAEAVDTAVDNNELLRSLYEHAVVVDGHLDKLRTIDAPHASKLISAAHDYLTVSRDILLRRASSQRHRLKLADDLQNLRNHMRADNRTGAWITQAVRAKERVEEVYRDFRVASTALGALLESFPALQARIAPHVEAVVLIDDSLVGDARTRIAATARDTTRELDRYANLDTYR
jgi:hypothetical protein